MNDYDVSNLTYEEMCEYSELLNEYWKVVEENLIDKLEK
jgi:hypothetical protein